MSADDDNDWLEALAGRRDADGAKANAGPSIATREALALRQGIRAVQAAEDAPTEPAVDAAREEALIKRARSAGLIAVPKGYPLGHTRMAWGLAALFMVVVGVGIWRTLLPPQERLRGVIDGTIHVEARDAPALKRQLTQELSAAGVQVHGYERLGHLGLDADLPQPVPPGVVRVLERHQLPIPADGALVIEIDPVGR